MLALLISSPAWAHPEKDDLVAASGNPQTQGKSAQSSSNSVEQLPVKALGFLVGSVVGIPVCAVRSTIYDEKYTIRQWTGDSDQKKLTIPAGVFWAPFAVFTGVGSSPLLAIKHSGKKFNAPFSKGQFSLGDDQFLPNPQAQP
jgi:hypothetical protein